VANERNQGIGPQSENREESDHVLAKPQDGLASADTKRSSGKSPRHAPRSSANAAPSFIEIRRRLQAFSVQWKNAKRENADAKLFWARFYECYGIRPESATIYEKAVEKLDGARGFIDSFIPGLLIVEHKSRGRNLDSAFMQAADYFMALPEGERPRYIVTSDFVDFHRILTHCFHLNLTHLETA
jgi:hypothetical protein